jgi:YfiH family protein
MTSMISRTLEALRYQTFGNLDDHRDITCCTTTRLGGVSSGVFASLNLGLRSGDDPAAVRDNRAQLSLITNAFPDLLTFAKQVHGNNVAVVTGSEIGSGATETDTAIPATDALVTNIPDVPLVVLVADCCPIGLYDPVRRVVAMVHAGWRGTAAGIAAAAVVKMTEEFGSDPADLCAGIGPCIGVCCYEVGKEVYERFQQAFPEIVDEVFIAHDGRFRLDLALSNQSILETAGVAKNNIETAALCTSCNTELFFSHRAEKGKTGRFGALIMLHDRTKRVY